MQSEWPRRSFDSDANKIPSSLSLLRCSERDEAAVAGDGARDAEAEAPRTNAPAVAASQVDVGVGVWSLGIWRVSLVSTKGHEELIEGQTDPSVETPGAARIAGRGAGQAPVPWAAAAATSS